MTTPRPTAAQLRLLRWARERIWIETSVLTALVTTADEKVAPVRWRLATRRVYAMCRRLVADGLLETQIPWGHREWRATDAGRAALTAAEEAGA